MNIAFFWTGEFSRNILESLLKTENINVKMVVSQPDKAVWRKKILEKTPIKILAEENNIEVLQPKSLKKNFEFFEKLKNLDFIVVVAYWKIVPNEVLDAPKYWCINVHWSILPAYRWASPIQEAVKNGDLETGITIMYMSEGMDEWDILAVKKVDILETDKSSDIFKKFEEISPEILIQTLEKIFSWKIKAEKQDDSKATYCSKIKKEDWEINFEKESWEKIYNKFRAYFPWPGIYSFFEEKKFNIEDCELLEYLWEKKVWEVEKIDKKNIWIITSDNKFLKLKQIKLEWKKSMDIISFVNWNKDFLDYKF